MKRKPAIPHLTLGQANYVLAEAVADRKLSYNDIVSYLARITRDIRELEGRIERLQAVAQPSSVRSVRRPERGNRKPSSTGDSKHVPRSPEHQASMQLQGQYVGLLRRMPEGRKAAIQKLARSVGRESAIAVMQQSLERAPKK